MRSFAFSTPNSPRSGNGCFVLENARGEVVRTFAWAETDVFVIYRHDTRRVETIASPEELQDLGVEFDVLAVTTTHTLKVAPLDLNGRGRLLWMEKPNRFPPSHELLPEREMKSRSALGWSVVLQGGVAALFVVLGWISGSAPRETKEVSVTVLPQAAVDKLLEQAQEKLPAVLPPAKMRERQVVVAPSARKINRHAQVPTQSNGRSFANKGKGPRGGGYKGEGPRGYGTNEPYMNSIGALGALDKHRVKGGNGGSGGVNLRAVGTEPGSGAGGKGYGGFGNNGGGGRGRGGLGRGAGQGLANAMYGRGLIAAPFGEGSPAPGSGGYGTRGKAGGGAQGAGYGTETIVGSWKGTGPKGYGPSGSGSGSGDPNGSPWGAGDGGDTIVTGGLDKEQIESVIRRNIGQITYCYERALQKQPNLAGRVTVRFQIAGNGHVSVAHVKDSSVRSAQVESCIVEKLKNWTFPKPYGGVNVAVTYPFALRRTVSMR